MEMYQHDSSTTFEFVLRGELAGDRVQDLQHAWETAKSILGGKQLVVEISGITKADSFGVDLLSLMRESGARLIAARPAASVDFVRSMGIPTPAASECRNARAVRVLRRFRTLLRALLGRSGPEIRNEEMNLLVRG